mgnify:CR=1 FL=1
MAENQEMTWEQKTAQRLEAEMAREAAVPVEQEPQNETPPEDTESEDEVGALSVDENEGEEDSDLDETPDDDAPEEVVDWEKRAKDNQAAFTEKAEEVSRLNEEFTQVTEEYTRGRFELEDATNQARQAHEFLMNMASHRANQARQINLATLPPEQVAQAQLFMQQALAEEQQLKGAYDNFVKQSHELKEKETQREAVVARKVLERQIPDFQNTYPDIIKHMVASGMSQREAQETINPAIIRAFYQSMKVDGASSTVKVEKQTKARPPKSRLVQNQTRGLDGKFKKADEAFRKTTDPRQRVDAWEEKKRLQLAKERR